MDLISPDLQASPAEKTSILADSQIDHLLINGAYLSSTVVFDPTAVSSIPDLFLSGLHKSITANIAGPVLAIDILLSLLRAGDDKKVTYISLSYRFR